MFPGASILIVTRAFEPLMTSMYNQFVRMGYQGPLTDMCENFAVSGAADYDYLINLYWSAFGEEKTIIIPFEMLQEDEIRFTRHLEERLGLEHNGILIGKINESLTLLELHWCRRVFRAFGRLNPVLGEVRYRTFHNRLTHRSLRGGLSPVLAACKGLTPRKGLDAPAFPTEVLELCRGKASHLRELPEYASYLQDYLLD
jgi:hypothetical protein